MYFFLEGRSEELIENCFKSDFVSNLMTHPRNGEWAMVNSIQNGDIMR